MKLYLVVALFAVAAGPLVNANYAPQAAIPTAYGPVAASGGLEEYINAAAGRSPAAANQLTAAAEIQPTPEEARGLARVQAQLQALNANTVYQNMKNSENIAETLAESNLAANIRQGKINVVSPQVIDQQLYRSMLVPSGANNHQVIATQPLPPIIVHQPGAPPAQISSGPPTVVRGNPVIYKIKPSVIYQQEVINKVPTPLSLNPVYVKVYKPGKKIEAPLAPVAAPAYQQPQPYAAPAADTYGAAADAPLYASPAPYNPAPYNPAPYNPAPYNAASY